jgi:hypothetical protein
VSLCVQIHLLWYYCLWPLFHQHNKIISDVALQSVSITPYVITVTIYNLQSLHVFRVIKNCPWMGWWSHFSVINIKHNFHSRNTLCIVYISATSLHHCHVVELHKLRTLYIKFFGESFVCNILFAVVNTFLYLSIIA